MVMEEAEQLRPVVKNLVNNGCEAMPSRGWLTVAVGRASDFPRLEVSDDGEGITEENRPNIFDPLFTPKTQGTGLGPCIRAKIIAQHGGTIDADFQPGRGTTFTESIPLAPQESMISEVSA